MNMRFYAPSAYGLNGYLFGLVLACYFAFFVSSISKYSDVYHLYLVFLLVFASASVTCFFFIIFGISIGLSWLQRSAAVAARVCLVLSVGALLWGVRIQMQLDKQLPVALDNNSWVVEGRVRGPVESDGMYRRFQFDVESLTDLDQDLESTFAGVIRLSWRTDAHVVAGEKRRLLVKLKRPRGFVNPNAFDYQLWLLAKGIQATGYVKQAITDASSALPIKILEGDGLSGRNRLNAELSRVTSELEHRALMNALLLGDKSDISSSEWSLFQSTGTVHLMAISGLHIGMIAALSFLLMSWFVRAVCTVLSLRRGRAFFFERSLLCQRTVVSVFSMSAALFYAYLAGFSIPTQRAFFCVFIVGVCWVSARRTSYIRVLLYIALTMMTINPFTALQPGFILSFSAVALLILCFANRKSRFKAESYWSVLCEKTVRFFMAQWVLLVGLAPLMMALNLPVSLVAPAVNSLAIPFFSTALMPLLFLALALMPISEQAAYVCFALCDVLLKGFIFVLELFHTHPLYFSQLNSLALIALFITAVLVLLPHSLFIPRYKMLIVFAATSFLIFENGRPLRDDAINITVLDVGQGLSTVVDMGGDMVIYDIGAKFSDKFSIADRVLLPHLYSLGKRERYSVIISHADNDHAGGYASFIPELEKYADTPVSTWSGEPEKIGLNRSNSCQQAHQLNTRANTRAQTVTPPVDWRVLWPEDNHLHSAISKTSNNKSCVLLIEVGDLKFLFMGDVEREVERQLLKEKVLPSNVDVLIAAHHGSASSSTTDFIAHVQPRHVVFSAGYKNRYRHPSAKVQARFEASGSKIWNTALHGAISIEVASGQVYVSAERCTSPKLWHWGEIKCVNEASSLVDGIRYDERRVDGRPDQKNDS